MKKIIATVATLAFAVSFIGCGGAGDNPGESVEVSEEDTSEEEDSTAEDSGAEESPE